MVALLPLLVLGSFQVPPSSYSLFCFCSHSCPCHHFLLYAFGLALGLSPLLSRIVGVMFRLSTFIRVTLLTVGGSDLTSTVVTDAL